MRLALTALLTLALGWPLLRAVRAPQGTFGWLEALVLAGGLGVGLASLLQLLALHVSNGQPWALEAVVALALFAVVPRARCGGGVPTPPPGEPEPRGRRRARLALDVALGLAVALMLAEQVRTFLGLTLLAPLGQWDGKAIWNLKARFLFRAGPDWRDVTDPGLALSHVDYPWLVPLAVLRSWQAHGQESAALAAALAGAFGLGTLVLVVCGLRRERGPLTGWAAGLLLLATTRLVSEASAQQADVPVAFWVVAMLGTLASWNGSAKAPLAVAGLCGSLAAWTKNEGGVWLLATGGVVLLAGLGRPRLRGKLGPAWTFALGALPGALVLAFFKVAVAGPNDLAGMTTAGTLAERWLDPARWKAVAAGLWGVGLQLVPPCLATEAAGPAAGARIGLLALVVLAVLLGARWRGRHPRAVLVTAAVLACLFGLWAIFVSTPVDLDWHLKTSAGRLLLQLWPAAVFASLLWTSGALAATRSNPARALPGRTLTATEYWWDVLGTAAEEGEQFLYEPFALAAGLRDTTPQDRVMVAEQTLCDLHERDLIYFYRGRPEPDVALAGDRGDRLTREEVERVLADRSWHPRRPGAGYQGDGVAVRFDATEAGVKMFQSAPPEIRTFWRGG